MRRTAVERDAALIYAAGFIRSATVGLVGVVLAIYLSKIGLSTAAIGLVIGSGLAGAAAATLVVGLRADRVGRQRTLICDKNRGLGDGIDAGRLDDATDAGGSAGPRRRAENCLRCGALPRVSSHPTA